MKNINNACALFKLCLFFIKETNMYSHVEKSIALRNIRLIAANESKQNPQSAIVAILKFLAFNSEIKTNKPCWKFVKFKVQKIFFILLTKFLDERNLTHNFISAIKTNAIFKNCFNMSECEFICKQYNVFIVNPFFLFAWNGHKDSITDVNWLKVKREWDDYIQENFFTIKC